MHPKSVALWKKAFLERGPELFAGAKTAREYERRIGELERLLGKKEVAIDAIDWMTKRADPSMVDVGVLQRLVETDEFVAIGVLEIPVIETLHRMGETPGVERKVEIRTQHRRC